jgi:AraC-like DNA-binding protein
MDYQAWVWFIDYVPLLFLILSLWFFWVKYFQIKKSTGFKKGKSTLVSHVRLLLLMSALSFTCLLWIIFTFVGWKYFSIIEFSLAFLILVFSFLIFLDNENFQFLGRVESNVNFPNYDDSKQLARLEQMLVEKQLYLRPELSLKELSGELKLPSGYVSYLINRYYHKNFKGLINDYRIQAFIQKANLPEEKHKTYLSLALESGFNSKSTFNQAFKSVTGQSPSEYLT